MRENPILETRLWRVYGIRIAIISLAKLPQYQASNQYNRNGGRFHVFESTETETAINNAWQHILYVYIMTLSQCIVMVFVYIVLHGQCIVIVYMYMYVYTVH